MNNGHADDSKYFNSTFDILKFIEIYEKIKNCNVSQKDKEIYEKITRFALELKEYLRKKGLEPVITKKTLYLFEPGDSQSVGRDARTRNERSRFRKQIDKMMEEKGWTIDDVIEHYNNNRNNYTKGFLTQANKMKYELDMKRERELLETLEMKRER
jgi:hypothetical protein